ncbi:N-acetylmuramoyl-L-alanine amidase [Nocardia sp. NPDC051570]|uniref:N-acetylmuramoyl-L-alanine amidase n=1 Tax=Nocardia sp. NPDC051570 TaxID=3364324 RepID=UPI0037A687D2
MPYRRPQRPYLLPVVTALAVAAPLATLILRDAPEYRPTTDSNPAAIPAQLAEVALASAPDVLLPLRELTGLDLPDLHLSDLRNLPLPRAIPLPPGLPNPLGGELPNEIPLPRLGDTAPDPAPSGPSFIAARTSADDPAQVLPAGDPGTPAITPGAAGPGTPAITPGTVGPGTPALAPGAADPGTPALAPGAAGPGTPAITPGAAGPGAPAITPGAAGPGTPLTPGATDPGTPALTPGAVGPELTDKVGADVKELRRDTPFSMVALTAKDLAGTRALVRARKDDGNWGSWYNTDRVETARDDHVRGEKTGTEPVFVGNTKAVQVLVTHKAATTPPPRTGDPAQAAAADLSAVLIDPGHGAVDGNLAEVAAPLFGGGPKVISRAQWGADESDRQRCPEQPTYDDGLGGITVHHTAGRNDYSREESAGIVRAIFAYHAKTLNWCDIGYNALVDKYGQVFEGRFGGLDRPVQGAHAGGFNENTSGVAIMGDFQTEPPTEEAIQAVGQFIGWRAKIAGLDPKGHTTMYSEGTDYTPYPEGTAVQLPIVFAHRDVGSTTCPGDAAYALMDRIRDIAASAAGAPSSNDVKTAVGANDPNAAPLPAPAPKTQQSQRNQTDLATLANLTTRILNLLDQNVIAKYYAAQGGPNGRLGAAASEPTPTRDGGQYVKFVNGYVYAAPDGTITEVVGHILDRFVQLGAESGILGLPARNSYPVPDGTRADFQYGSLILNTATGLVTTLLRSYSDITNSAPPPPNPPAAQPVPAPPAR